MESLNTINFKNIPNTHYSCHKCISVPEFFNIVYRNINIEYECPEHEENKIGTIFFKRIKFYMW